MFLGLLSAIDLSYKFIRKQGELVLTCRIKQCSLVGGDCETRNPRNTDTKPIGNTTVMTRLNIKSNPDWDSCD
jgi:hypothetical protein